MKPVSRSSGRSAVASAAYRAGECITNERDGLTHDFTRRGGMEHAEIVLPSGVEAEWEKDRSVLWNAAERAENRKDARVAREFEIALPHELSAEQRLEATREFAQGLADRYGAAVDFAIHAPHGKSDDRNHHAHLMMTVRSVGAAGLGDKTFLERENKWLLLRELPTSQMQLRDVRQSWEQIANQKMAAAGLDMRIDHRSYQERGVEIEPTEHMGVHATQMQRRGMDVSRARLDEGAAQRNAELIREKPEQVLSIITGEKSVFDRHDVARALHRYIDQPEAFRSVFAKVMASSALVELQGERVDAQGEVQLARYSTREMVEIERGMAERAMRMAERFKHGVSGQHVEAALAAHDAAIRLNVAADLLPRIERGEMSKADAAQVIGSARLSDEQRRGVEHITGAAGLAAVVGFAGAGKSTMLAAAREAWEAEGYKVYGAALSGKAAEGLQESSGIASRTLASWDYGWNAGRGELTAKDVLVIDEAGMVGSRQLARFVSEAERTGAKLVLVGDHEQLQAIGAGAPFRAIAERVGFAELQEIRRQRQDWQRAASSDFARHKTAQGLSAYASQDAVTFAQTRDEARAEIVRDYMRDMEQRGEGSRVAMAHRRVDVRALNADIRAARQERGQLASGQLGSDKLVTGQKRQGELLGHELLGRELLGRERVFQTNDGPRAFARGDRIVFLENNRDLGVKNGMLGTVSQVEEGRITARLDGKGRDGAERVVSVAVADYAAIDHGYATTIHKTQGATVDRSFVLASGTMDRHLTYVAMTRHRDGAQLYAAKEEFAGRGAQQSPGQADVLKNLAERLGRDGSKETTLDYAKEFSERRGIAETLGVKSEIDVSRQVASQAQVWERQREPDPERELQAPDARNADKPRQSMVEGQEHQADRLRQRQVEPDPAQKRDTRHDEERGQEHQQKRSQDARKVNEPGVGNAEKSRQQVAESGAHQREPEPAQNNHAGQEPEQRKSAAQVAARMPEAEALAVQQPARKRSMFAGLKLESGRGAERASGVRVTPAVDKLPMETERSRLLQATEGYAKAYADAARMQGMGLPIVEHQKQALATSGGALDAVRPGSTRELNSAMHYDSETRRAMTELKGSDRAAKLVAGMDRERQAQLDPNVRAERLVARWNGLEAEHGKLRGHEHMDAREKIEVHLRSLAAEIGKDAQVETALREKQKHFGIEERSSLGRALRQDQVGQALENSVDRGLRQRGQGMER